MLDYLTFGGGLHFEHAISSAGSPARLSAASLSLLVQSDTRTSPKIPTQHEQAQGTGPQSVRPANMYACV